MLLHANVRSRGHEACLKMKGQVALAGAEGLEPTTLGFGDRCSTN